MSVCTSCSFSVELTSFREVFDAYFLAHRLHKILASFYKEGWDLQHSFPTEITDWGRRGLVWCQSSTPLFRDSLAVWKISSGGFRTLQLSLYNLLTVDPVQLVDFSSHGLHNNIYLFPNGVTFQFCAAVRALPASLGTYNTSFNHPGIFFSQRSFMNILTHLAIHLWVQLIQVSWTLYSREVLPSGMSCVDSHLSRWSSLHTALQLSALSLQQMYYLFLHQIHPGFLQLCWRDA